MTISPLVVRGTGFEARERIVVTVRSGPIARTATARSEPDGGLAVRFASAFPRPRCGTLTVTAVGGRGDRASWTSPARMCGGPLRP